jgi:hypothetical protein
MTKPLDLDTIELKWEPSLSTMAALIAELRATRAERGEAKRLEVNYRNEVLALRAERDAAERRGWDRAIEATAQWHEAKAYHLRHSQYDKDGKMKAGVYEQAAADIRALEPPK